MATPRTTDTAYDRAIAYAQERGREDGENAAAWYVQDVLTNRVRDTAITARMVLRGIENGDPAVLDTFPVADLSGEWADTLTGPQLVADAVLDAVVDIAQDAGESDDWFSDICDAYETAFD